MSRRDFLRDALQSVAAASCAGSVWYALIAQQAAAAPHTLRPPGALATDAFGAACIKCGRCVAACPYGTLKLADLAGHGASGMPWFEPRGVPCYMCSDVPCVNACPTEALARLDDIAKARMGVAVVDAEACLSWQGLRCEVCYRVCPLRGSAIRIETHPRGISKHAVFVPIVSSDACTGCGLCEFACPTEIASIRVVAPSLVKGRIGDHYRIDGPRRGAPETVEQTKPSAMPPAVERRTVEPADAPAPGVDYLNRATP